MNKLYEALAILGKLDDRVQAGARSLYGQRDGRWSGTGGEPSTKSEVIGDFFHRPRPNSGYARSYDNDMEGYIALLASRGLQAGGLTAAGIGLAQLTQAYQDYTGIGDQPTQDTLYM